MTIDALFVILDVSTLDTSPVLESQVGEQLLALERAGVRTGLLTTARDMARFDAVVGRKLRDAGIHVVVAPHRGRTSNVLRLAGSLRALAADGRVRTTYARGVWGPLVIRLAKPLSPLPYVYDIRGTLGDETRASARPGALAKATVWDRLERWCVTRATRVTTVSAPFADELRRSYGRGDAVVIPSCVELSRVSNASSGARDVREQCGFAPDDLVLVYSGGIDRYQQLPRLLELWRQLSDDPHVRFLMLTPLSSNAREIDSLLSHAELAGRVVRRSVARSEVPAYLAAADVGFILREPRLMNRVASPVKFAEYVAAGLAVVASTGIGDMSSLIEEHRLGGLLSTADVSVALELARDVIDDVRRDREGFRARAKALAAARYDWDVYAPVYRELYGVSAKSTAAD